MLCCALNMLIDRKERRDYEMDILPCYAVRADDEMSKKEIAAANAQSLPHQWCKKQKREEIRQKATANPGAMMLYA